MMNKKTLQSCSIIAVIGMLIAILIFSAFWFFWSPSESTVVSNSTPTVQPVFTESLFPTSAPIEKTATPTEIPPEKLYKSVVRISAMVFVDNLLVEGWAGSGSVVSEDGLILTNAHVVLSDEFYEVEELQISLTDNPDFPAEPSYYAEVVQVDRDLDLAVIRIHTDLARNPVQRANLNLPVFKLGNSDSLQLGDPLRILGYPDIGGKTITLSTGAVGGFTAEEGVVGRRAFIKTSASFSGGNSGGSAVNDDNELIGVPTELGAGGDEQIVDCRILADTNGDGVVDNNDSCVPTGGFINALRPINLAIPLIEAAKRGEIYLDASPVHQYEPGEIILEDDFSSDLSGWTETDSELGFAGYKNGKYIIQVDKKETFLIGINDTLYTDIIINVDVELLQSTKDETGTFGLICRYIDVENFYKFEINEDGFFTIYKFLEGDFYSLYNWEYLPELEGDKFMNVTMACMGETLLLFVEDRAIAAIQDSSFDKGYIGLAADVINETGIIVSFDNLTVYAP